MPNIVQNYNETTNDPEYPLTYEEAILDPDGNPIKGYVKETVVAPQYDPTTGTYAVGDPVMNDKKYYRCNTAVSTPEDFDTTKWTEKTISEEIDGLNQSLTELQNNRIGTYVSLNTYTTFANAFVAPSDGYITAISGGTLGDVIMVDVENKVHISSRCDTTNYSVYTTLFIRKGMRVHVNTNTGNRGNSYFYPIT